MKLARPTKFAHVLYANPALAFLTYDDEHHRLAFADMGVLAPNDSEADKHDAIGVDHVAYSLGRVGDLFENYALLKEKGILPYWCVHNGITVSMYYADPDGNQMEFQVDRCGSGEEATEFMTNNWVDNPVGVEYDPDQLLAAYRSGTPETELLSFYNGGPVSPIRGAFAKIVGSP